MTRLRIARESDLPQIVDIYNSTIASRQVTADLEPVTVEERLPWFREHVPASRPLWVVDNAGTIDAWLSFSNFYGRPAYHHTVEVSIYVRDTARGQGLGSYLLKEAIAQSPTLQINTLLGFIFEHNQPSMRLFEHFKFGRWGTLPQVAVLDDIERSLVIMGRRTDVAAGPSSIVTKRLCDSEHG